jgi:hypothetical protein
MGDDSSVGSQFWVAAVLTIASSGLAVLASLEPTPIERLFGVDSDTYSKC